MCLILVTGVFAQTNVSILHGERTGGGIFPLAITDSNVLRVNINLINITSGNLTVNDFLCLGGICINTWDSVNQTGGSGGGNSSAEMIAATTGNINSTSWNRFMSFVFLANVGDFVGIGTETPSTKLEVAGNVTINNTLFYDTNIRPGRAIELRERLRPLSSKFVDFRLSVNPSGGNAYLQGMYDAIEEKIQALDSPTQEMPWIV